MRIVYIQNSFYFLGRERERESIRVSVPPYKFSIGVSFGRVGQDVSDVA